MKKYIASLMLITTISLVVGMGQVHASSTATFYPVAYPGGPLDGTVGRFLNCNGGGESLSDLAIGQGNQASTNNDVGGGYLFKLRTDNLVANKYCQSFASMFCFNVTLGNVTIQDAYIDLFGVNGGETDLGNTNWRWVLANNPSDLTQLSPSDYSLLTQNPVSDLISINQWVSQEGYRNTNHIYPSAINTNGVTCLATVPEEIRTRTAETNPGLGLSEEIFTHYSESPDLRPTMVLTYTGGSETPTPTPTPTPSNTPTPTPTPTPDATLKQQILDKIQSLQDQLDQLKTLANQL